MGLRYSSVNDLLTVSPFGLSFTPQPDSCAHPPRAVSPLSTAFTPNRPLTPLSTAFTQNDRGVGSTGDGSRITGHRCGGALDRATQLLLDSPGEAVGAFAGGELAGYFHFLQVDGGNVVFGAYRYVGARAIGHDQDACRAAAEIEGLYFFVRREIENHHVCLGLARCHARDQHLRAVGSNLQAIAAHRDRERLKGLLGGDIDDRYGAVLRVGYPELLAVGRNVKAFGAAARRDIGDAPCFSLTARRRTGRRRGACRGAGRRTPLRWTPLRSAKVRHRRIDFFEDADRSGTYVRREHMTEIGGDHDHMRPVLPRAHHPIHRLRAGMV